MTERERTLETLLFGRPDRIPLNLQAGRRSTRKAWHEQGLPAELTDSRAIEEYAYRQVGGTLEWPAPPARSFFANERMIPQFEEKVLEERERSIVVQDWEGNICEISNEYTAEYLRNPIDFVTRRWIKCPVENREDWEAMKERYDPEDPSRLPADSTPGDPELAERHWFLELGFSGPFWQLREWLGFENLCILMAEDPEFVLEMVRFWEQFLLRLFERIFQYVIPDSIHISEDMAFKEHSMISPEMVRRFLLPTWRRWGEAIRAAGVPLYSMDSDGFIGELIPLWMEAGINSCDPIEVAAGNDIVEFRRAFGRKMSYRGGVDKRAMARGGAVLEAEMDRIQPVVEEGGYIPSCDHGIPADVSWNNYLHYVRRLAGMSGWL